MSEETPDKSVQFITKLVQLTQDGELQWTSVPVPLGSVSPSAFVALVNGKKLRIFKVQRTVMVPDMIGSIFGREPTTKPKAVQRAILEVLDDFEQVTYTFDRIAGLDDLYQSASFSASGLDDLMNSVLGKKNDK
jgi:hypothetical protein